MTQRTLIYVVTTAATCFAFGWWAGSRPVQPLAKAPSAEKEPVYMVLYPGDLTGQRGILDSLEREGLLVASGKAAAGGNTIIGLVLLKTNDPKVMAKFDNLEAYPFVFTHEYFE